MFHGLIDLKVYINEDLKVNTVDILNDDWSNKAQTVGSSNFYIYLNISVKFLQNKQA